MKKHKNVIELLGFVEERDFLVVVLELANQTLSNFVKKSGNAIRLV
jgi:hypothetical protein